MSKPRLTEEQKDAIASAYEQGERIADIAARFRVDSTYPGLLAKRRNLKPRNKSVWMTQAVQS